MKKIFFALLLTISSLFATDLTIGAGPYVQTQPYKGADPIIVPSPVIFYDNGVIYARWTRFGVYFLGKKQKEYSWGFSLTVQPRPNGYSPDDSSYLEGLDEKKSSFEGGLAFTLYGGGKYIEIMVMNDLLNRYNSYIAKVETGFKYQLGNFTFYPNIVVVYESKQFTQYYYGISSSESTRTSYDIYQPSGGVRVAAQTYINYPFYDSWELFMNLRADKLSSKAKDSPIVEDSYSYSGIIALMYRFKI
ncbi:MAG: MipA/OmpV family protein [Epsilonproteobacteria bacterium]|nr:MipA/OmpV family protein [Campylobacterota bacterium]